MNCELCGYSDDKFYRAEIEGSTLVVCSKCASFGKVLEEVESEQKIEVKPQKSYGFVERNLKLDYAEILRKAMEGKQVSVETLSESIKASPYEVKKILSGKIVPTDEIGERLERSLGVSIYEDVVGTFESARNEDTVSLGDVAQITHKQG